MATLRIECYRDVSYKQGSATPIPAGYLGMKTITTAASTDRVQLATGTKYISMTTDDTVDLFYELGDSTVEAALTDRPFDAGEARLDRAVESATYIACIKA